MVDIYSQSTPITISLPADLIAELRLLAQEQHVSVDEVVRDACLEYTEPYIWERCFRESEQTQPNQQVTELGIDGKEITPATTDENSV